MKKVFLLFAAIFTATVMNLHADKANIDLTSGHTTSGQSLVTYDLDANISIVMTCSKAKISNDGSQGTSFEPAGTITVKAAGGCTITSVTLECVPYHCPDYSECGFLSGSSTPGISNISQYSFFSGSATQVVWTFNNMEASCILSKASVTYTKPEPDTLYLNTGGNTLWNQDGAKFSAFYWNDGVAGKFTDFLELAYGETDIYRAIIPKSDSVSFVRHAATAEVPSWDNKLHYTKGEEINMEDNGNIMIIEGWGPTDRYWDRYTPKAGPVDPVKYLAPVYNTAGDPKSGILRWDTLSCSSYTVVADASSTVTWNAGWYVVNGADVKLTAGAKCSGEVHLILADGAKLTANGKMIEYAGIQISNKNYSLTIYGQANQTGQLIATGADAVAGIGGSQDDGDAYNITINGGVVTATGGDYAAGIGGLKGSNDITINGGTVTATGGNNAAGIGSGYSSLGEDITINGGTVTATGGNGAAGIGGGKDGRGQDIYINGGTITANGSNGVSGIGSGQGGDAARNIFVNPSLILKADNNNPPTTVIAATRTATTDVASLLAGKQYVMASGPDTLDYLHFVSLKAGGSVKMSKKGTPAEPVLEYSKDNRKSWSKFDIANGTTFDNVGDTIWFRAGKNGVAGTNTKISSSVQNYFYFAFGENDSIAAGGNIMSLLDGTCEQKSVPDAGLCYLFYNAKQLISAPELPATTLANSCYYGMFYNCTSLTTAPELPATTIAMSCYASMFRGCTKLENGPTSLPAAVLVGSCYSNMFIYCAKLKNAPAMNVTTLADRCCNAMFQGCSNLIVDPYTGECDGVEMQLNHEGEVPSQWNSDMFEGCHGTITKPTIGGHYCIKEFVPEPDMHDMLYFVGLNGNDTVRLNKLLVNSYFGPLTATFEYSKDRKNWTAYDTWGAASPITMTAEGSAIALAKGDTVFFRAKGVNGKNATLSSRFNYFIFAFGAGDSIAAGGNAMSLYDATCEQDTMTMSGFQYLFSGATQLVSAPKLPATQLATSCYYSMFRNCISLAKSPELKAITLAEECYGSMFYGCTSLTIVPDTLPATALVKHCYYYIFYGCTALTTAPELPATTMAEGCYKYMFVNCSALTKAPKLKADILAPSCYMQMFYGCSSLEVDTCTGSCDGAELEVPTVSGTAPTFWNLNMFTGCKGNAKYTAQDGIQLGGHYCIKEFVPDSIKGIELVAVDTQYDGQNHNIQVNGTIEGDKVTYSTDSATWAQDTIKLKKVGEQTVYVRVQRTDHYDWYGKSSIKIAKKDLTVDSVIIAEKMYDGTYTATVKSSKLVGVVKGESVGLDVRGDFNDKNAGKDKDVTVEYRLEGSEEVISNYTLQTTSETVKGTITPKQLTVAGIVVDAKTYNATTDATVSAPGVLEGVIGSDDVSIESATGAFADKDAGKDKDVSVVYTLKGEDAANYEVLDGESNATINPRELTLESVDLTKEYDGTPLTAEGTTIKATGYVEGECLNYSFIGSQTAVGENSNSFDYTDSDSAKVTNYDVIAIYGTLEVIPSTELITITANSDHKIFDGTPLTNDGYQVAGKLGAGDYVSDVVVEGTITQIGTAPNEVKGYEIYNMDGEKVTSFYANVKVENGTLTVKGYGTCAEANATPVGELLALNPVVVTYVDGAYTYVQDATGASLIYVVNGYGLKAGEQVTGFIGKSAPDGNGLPRIIPRKKPSELTIVTGPEPEPELRTAAPTMNEIHQYVRYENVKIDSLLITPFAPVEATLDNGDKIALNSRFGRTFILEEDETTTYDIVAIVGVRDEVMELYPILISIHTTVKLNNVNADNRVIEKYVLDGQLYIRVNGVVYDAAGNRR